MHLDGGGRVDVAIPDGHNLVMFAYSGRVKALELTDTAGADSDWIEDGSAGIFQGMAI